MVDRAVIRVDSVRTPAGTSTNVVSFRDEFIMQNDPRFVPNVYDGVGMKFDHEWHQLTIVFDSDTDIFDNYIDDDGPNPVVPSLIVDFTVVIIATEAQVTERWTYSANDIYVRGRGEGEIEAGRERQPFTYELIAYDDRAISYP
jgi:hypothetical protein